MPIATASEPDRGSTPRFSAADTRDYALDLLRGLANLVRSTDQALADRIDALIRDQAAEDTVR